MATDGTSNTVMLGENMAGIRWVRPTATRALAFTVLLASYGCATLAITGIAAMRAHLMRPPRAITIEVIEIQLSQGVAGAVIEVSALATGLAIP